MERGEGIPYGRIEAYGEDVVHPVPRRKGIMGENWQKDKTADLM